MLKLIIPFLILNIALNANEMTKSQLEDCEDSYLLCISKCEEKENIVDKECITKCENTYYECEAKVLDEADEKSVNVE